MIFFIFIYSWEREIHGVYPFENEVYYLVPMFKEVNDHGEVEFPLCQDCREALSSGKLSDYMLASENYGVPQSVLGMKVFDLSVLSKNCIFPIRSYGNILELQGVTGNAPVLKGSMIHFNSESIVLSELADGRVPIEVGDILPMSDGHKFMSIQYLGDNEGLDRIKKSLGGQKLSPVSVDAIFNMDVLRKLQRLHPEFKLKTILSDQDGVSRQLESFKTVMREIVMDPSSSTAILSSTTSSNLAIQDPEIRGIDETVLYKRAISTTSPELHLLAAARKLFGSSAEGTATGI
jgi:hypothetical protein